MFGFCGGWLWVFVCFEFGCFCGFVVCFCVFGKVANVLKMLVFPQFWGFFRVFALVYLVLEGLG